MKLKDKRLKLTMEIIQGIRVIKLYAWERALIAELENIRATEIALIRKTSLFRSAMEVLNITSPILVFFKFIFYTYFKAIFL